MVHDAAEIPVLQIAADGALAPSPAFSAQLGWPLSDDEQARVVAAVTGSAPGARMISGLLERGDARWSALAHTDAAGATRLQLARDCPTASRDTLLESVLDALPINIFLKDEAGRLTFVNDATCRTIGKARPAILGRTDEEVFGPEVGPRLRQADLDAMADPENTLLHEEELQGPEGPRFLIAGKRRLPGRDAQGPMLLGFSIDITERKRLERALHAQRNFMRQVIDTDPNLIFVKDGAGNFRLVNQAVAELFGTTVEAIEHRPNAEVHDNQGEVEGYADDDRAVIRNGQTIRKEETVTRADGTTRWFQTIKCPLSLDQQEPLVLGISVDITERRHNLEAVREARDSAEAASRAKTEFLATMSHEIRTPMNGVIGMSGLLLDTSLTSEQRHFARTIRESAVALLDIINDILDFSKVEAGRLELEPVPFDATGLVRGAVDIISPRARDKGLALVEAVDPGVPAWLTGDVGRIRQVLVNLLGNAVKFTEQGWVEVRLRTHEADGQLWLHVEVEDTGSGIEEANQQGIFEAFRQGDNTATRQHGGTGLGLAISQRLCACMGGRIGVHSEPGDGSTFWFEVPVEIATAGPAPSFQAPELDGLQVLCICPDDAGPHPEMPERLRGWGAQVQCSTSGAEGLQMLLMSAARGPRPDVVVLQQDVLELAPAICHALVGTLASVQLLAFGDPRAPALRQLRERLSRPLHVVPPHQEEVLADVLATIAAGRSRPLPAVQRDGPMPRVLVAEDNPVNQDVARLMLEREGYRVDLVASGQEAIEAVQRVPYGVVLMDVQMPGMNGIEATRSIRSLPGAASQVPIVAMTANVMNDFRSRCLEAGMQDFVAKPIDRRSLQRALRRAIDSRGAPPAATPRSAAPAPPPPRAAEGAPAALDVSLAELDSLVADLGAGGVRSLVQTMERDGPSRCSRIATGLADNDLTTARIEAHTLRSATRALGMRGVAAQLQELESAAESGELAAARAAGEGLGAALDRALAILRHHLG